MLARNYSFSLLNVNRRSNRNRATFVYEIASNWLSPNRVLQNLYVDLVGPENLEQSRVIIAAADRQRTNRWKTNFVNIAKKYSQHVKHS